MVFNDIILLDIPEKTKYDVFISFAEDDRKVVESMIKEPLESKGYKVCWHHDEFLPGCTIFENMEKFIYESRFVIMLLSDGFMKSEFCLKELQICLKREKQTEMNYMIPVRLHDAFPLPLVIKDLTYINISDKNFVERIIRLLG